MFEPKYTRVVSSVRRNVGIAQSVVEIKLPTNEGIVNEVYTLSAKSSILNAEAVGRSISFLGLIDFQAMYESSGVQAVDYSAEYRDVFDAEREVLGELIVTSNVVDVSSEIENGVVRVVAIVETSIDEIASQDINALTGVEGEGVHVSTVDVDFVSYRSKAYEKFDVTGDLQLTGVKNVLMVTPCVSFCDVQLKENYLIIKGRLNVDICYKDGDYLQDIKCKNHAIDFSWEVACDGLQEGSIVQSVANVLYNEIKVSTVLEEGVATINLVVPISYVGYVFNKTTIETIGDMYLEKNYSSITYENFETLLGADSVKFKDNISGTAGIAETAPFIDDVLGVSTNNLVVASSRVNAGKLCIEGVVNSTVIYYTKETSSITSIQVEMPFSIEEKVDGCEASLVSICVEGITARSKRGKEIEVSAELGVYANMYCEKELCVVTGIVLGDEKAPDDCSLYIYIVRSGQTIWDVAKDVGMSQELILEQNPDVQLPLEAGSRLVLCKPNQVEF